MALPAVPVDRINKPNTTTPIGASFFNAVLAWMRAVTTGGAGSGLAADTVPGYGIGVIKDLGSGYDMDSLKTNGRFRITNPTGTGLPASPGTYVTVDVMASDASHIAQFVQAINSGATYMHITNDGSTWEYFYLWNRYTDGNVGQPPAPKPTATPVGGTYAPGYFKFDVINAGDAVYYSGGTDRTSAGQVWQLDVHAFEIATGVPDSGSCGRFLGTGTYWAAVTVGYRVFACAVRLS